MQRTAFYIINGITLYRIVSAFLLFYLIYADHPEIFKWLLAVSFFTDLIDGYLARKFQVTSVAGSFLDSIGDDLTVLAGMAGMYFFKYEFLIEQRYILLTLLGFFFLQIQPSECVDVGSETKVKRGLKRVDVFVGVDVDADLAS